MLDRVQDQRDHRSRLQEIPSPEGWPQAGVGGAAVRPQYPTLVILIVLVLVIPPDDYDYEYDQSEHPPPKPEQRHPKPINHSSSRRPRFSSCKYSRAGV